MPPVISLALSYRSDAPGLVQSLMDRDWAANNSVDKIPIGHQAKIVLKNSSGMEQQQSKPHDFL